MHMKFFVAFGLALAAVGCASVTSGPVATIRFAEPAAPGGLPGSFRELDRRTIAGGPEILAVPPGKHRIGYACPNTILMDGPLEGSAVFKAGTTYLLRCDNDGVASFEQQ